MRNGQVKAKLLSGIAASMILCISVSARAEDGTAADNESESSTDIVVTGEKQQTTLQKAPLALTAITADALKQSNINQLIDLNGFVPGLTVANSGSFVRVVSIRGVGYEATDNLSAQPGTAFHIDGVYVASPYALQQDFLDLQRVASLIHDARFRARSGHLLRLAVLRGRPASLAFVSPHSD